VIDRDQGKHLSRMFDFYPPDVLNLTRVDRPSAALRIIDTAPEVNADRAVGPWQLDRELCLPLAGDNCEQLAKNRCLASKTFGSASGYRCRGP